MGLINQTHYLLRGFKLVIILYKCDSDKEVINKDLFNSLTLTGTLREQSSVIYPTFTIESANPTIYNYCYIQDFGRYYYITDITNIRNNLWRIECVVDVLMSFKSQILNMGIIISETESAQSESYMDGSAWQRLVKSKTDIINFPSGLNSSGEYILITSGGIPTGSNNGGS